MCRRRILIPLVDFGFTFNEVPDKLAFFLELGECSQNCPCCHSPELQEDLDTKTPIEDIRELAEQAIDDGANAIVVMGGTTSRNLSRDSLVSLLRELSCVAPTCLYSGSPDEEEDKKIAEEGDCTWLKTGPYIDALGGLQSTRTNQRFYHRHYAKTINKHDCFSVHITREWEDETHKFWKGERDVT